MFYCFILFYVAKINVVVSTAADDDEMTRTLMKLKNDKLTYLFLLVYVVRLLGLLFCLQGLILPCCKITTYFLGYRMVPNLF